MRANCWNQRQHTGIRNSIVPHGKGNVVIIQETFGAIIEKLIFQWLENRVKLGICIHRVYGIDSRRCPAKALIFYLSFQIEFCFFASFDDSVPNNHLIYIILLSFVFSLVGYFIMEVMIKL